MSISLVASLLVKVTITTALALIGARLARKSRAAIRHVLLAAAFLVLLVLPIASIVAPSVSVTVPIAVQDEMLPPSLETIPGADVPSPPTDAGPALTSSPPRLAWLPISTLPTLLMAGWAAGTVLCLLPVLAGLWQVRSLRRSGLPWRHGRSVADPLALEAGIHRRVDLLLHESVPGPMTCGVVQPAIVLPMDAEVWTDEDLRRAVVHELEHVRRRDWASQCVARVVCACYWFHPLVWIAARQLALEAERACDDAVLLSTSLKAGNSTSLSAGPDSSTAYADQLVDLAQRLSTAPNQPLLAMANRAELAIRVVAVLDSRQRRGRAGVMWVAGALAASAVLVMTISPLRIVATAASAQTQAKADSPAAAAADRQFEVVSIKPCAAETLPPTQPGGRGAGPGNATTSPGRAHWECVTLGDLIATAYGGPAGRLRNSLTRQQPGQPQIVRGGPSWVYSDKYAIDAKAAGNADRATLIGPMLRALLEDRFRLKTHRAEEERSMYALTVAKGGLKIKSTAPGECWVHDPVTQPSPPPGAEDLRLCGNMHMSWNGGNRTLTLTGSLMQSFTDGVLSPMMDRFVINRTGLDGRFNIQWEFAPDDNTPGGMSGLAWSRREGALEPTAPSIFKAFEEQLGLKIEPTKAPAEYLVIDQVEKPSRDGASVMLDTPARGKRATQRFDVASIKPCAPEEPPPGGRGRGSAGGTGASISPGRFNVPCVTLEQLVYLAYASYGARENERLANDYLGTASDDKKVRGGPAWVHSHKDKYAIEATAPGVSDRTMLMGAMLRTLLEERFHLEIHRESETVQMYALRVAKSGFKLKPMKDGDCEKAAGPPPWTKEPCGFMSRSGGTLSRWRYVGFELSFLARQLAEPLGRHVIDETGVTGRFIIDFAFVSDEIAVPAAGDPAGAELPGAGASIFTAIEQQLGLKLEKTTGPRGFIVIDRAERPAPDGPASARAMPPGLDFDRATAGKPAADRATAGKAAAIVAPSARAAGPRADQ